jgi:hypothetical protein
MAADKILFIKAADDYFCHGGRQTLFIYGGGRLL